MVTVQVKILTASRQKKKGEFTLQVPVSCDRALERIEDEVDFSLLERLKFDMKLLINGKEVPASDWSSIELTEGDRIVIIPGVGGG